MLNNVGENSLFGISLDTVIDNLDNNIKIFASEEMIDTSKYATGKPYRVITKIKIIEKNE